MPKPVKVGRKERMSYGKLDEVCEMPNLIDVQTKSYKWFIEEGLQEVLDDVSPIRDTTNTMALEFVGYSFAEKPKYTQEECKERDATYATSLTVYANLIKNATDIKIAYLSHATRGKYTKDAFYNFMKQNLESVTKALNEVN